MPSKASVSNDLLLDQGPGDQLLDSGMKVSEAIARARQWWDARGRRQIATFAAAGCDDANFIPSGILNGEEWDRLTKAEKLKVCKTWHHMFVRRPDVLDVDTDAPFRLGRGETVQ